MSITSGTCLIITGMRAQMGPIFVKEALDRDYHVIGCSRRKEKIDHPLVSSVQITGEKIKDPNFWQGLLAEKANNFAEVYLVNTIGSAVPPEGYTIEDVNEKPVLAAAEALKKHGEKRGVRTAVGHLSTIAVSLFDPNSSERYSEPARRYCQSRLNADQKLQENDISTTIVRPGFVFNDLSEGAIDTGHDYSPEQFASLPLHPVVGNGQQVQQPVYQGDVVTAIMNGLTSDDVQVLDGVGPETVTQEEMFKFFVALKGKKFRPIKIPYDFALVIAKHFPRGRIAPYSIDLFKQIEENNAPFCTKKFAQAVGRPLVSLSSLYSNLDGKTLEFKAPPLKSHALEIFKKLGSDSEARRDVIRMVRKYGLELTGKTISALF